MRYSNAHDTSQDQTQYYPMTYTNRDGEETKYDLQQVRYDNGRLPSYIASESELNEGPGFDNVQTRYAVAHQAASAAMALNNPEAFPEATREIRPGEINLYQQRPDGDFDRVEFTEIGKNARSNHDIDLEQSGQTSYQSSKPDLEQNIQYTESDRDFIYREDVEKKINAPLHAPQETLQQREESSNDQWRDLSGPEIDRAAEQVILERQETQNQQQSNDQVQQMNQQQEQHHYSQQQ